MVTRKSTCGGAEKEEPCLACSGTTALPYWCETCKRTVADKRCPLCGLKAKKI